MTSVRTWPRLGAACSAVFCTLAQAAQAPAASAVPPSPVSLGGLLQVLVGLSLVLAAVLGAAWVLKRIAPGQTAAGGSVRVVGGVAVGPRERVVLVEVGETWLVLGVAPGSVNPLHTMARPPGAPAATESLSAADSRFAGWLKQAMRGRERGEP